MPLPLIPMAIGAVMGAMSNDEDRLKGALLGGVLGGVTGGFGGGTEAAAGEVLAQEGVKEGTKQVAKDQVQNELIKQAATETGIEGTNLATQNLLTGTQANPIAAANTSPVGVNAPPPSMFETVKANFSQGMQDMDAQDAAQFAASQGEQQQAPPPPPPLQAMPQQEFKPLPVEEITNSGQPTFVPKALFNAEVGTRVDSMEREKMLQMLRSRGLA